MLIKLVQKKKMILKIEMEGGLKKNTLDLLKES